METELPTWDVLYISDDDISILHRDGNGAHAMIPPIYAGKFYPINSQTKLKWTPRMGAKWIQFTMAGNCENNKFARTIRCSCGHQIPDDILKRFISMVFLLGR